MCSRAALPFALLAVFSILVLSSSVHTQSPDNPEPCLQSAGDGPHRKVIIQGITFDGPIHLPDSVVAQIVADANDNDWNADDLAWPNEFAQVGLREAWQNQGYFHVKVTAEAKSLGQGSSEERFQVLAHVDEGLQYHLGDISFAGSTRPFSLTELRNLIPLRDGDLFDVAKIREAIASLTKLYASHGFLDFTATPETQVDDRLQRISLVMSLDEQKQFRIGRIEVSGLDASTEAVLRATFRSGDVFNRELVDRFYQENKTVLPANVSPQDLQVMRNSRSGTADLRFTFLPFAIVEGTVVDTGGHPVQGASVYYQPADAPSVSRHYETETDCEGHFVMRHVLPGTAEIRAYKESDLYPDETFGFYSDTAEHFPSVQAAAGEVVQNVIVQLGRQNALLQIKLLDADTKQPVEGITFQMCRGNEPGRCISGGGTAHGVSTRLVPADGIRLTIGSTGYVSWSYEDEKTKSPVLELHSGEVKPLTIYLKRKKPKEQP